MLWEPTVSDDVLKEAVPLVSETLPRDVVPSLKITLPVAAPAPGGWAETVALNVTDCPKKEGFGTAVTLVVVAALLTTSAKVLDVLAAKLVSLR